MHDAAAHEAMPEAVDDGALEAAVLRMGDEGGELGEAFLARLRDVDLAEFRKGPGGGSSLAGRDVAAHELHRMVRVDGGEAVGVAQLPPVDEAVVTGGALHIDTQERLRDALGILELRHLGGAHGTSPDDALREPLTVRRRRDEFARELVVRLVGQQRDVEPVGDLLAPPVDVTRAGIIVAQEVVPKRHPVVGVVDIPREQRTHE